MKIGYDRDIAEKYGSRYSVIILAGDLFPQINDFVPMLHVDGRPAVEGLVEVAKAAGLEDITIVTGYEREKLVPVIARHEAKEAFNNSFEEGMFSSVIRGLQAVENDSKVGCFIIPVNCPLISVSIMRVMMAATEKRPDDFAEAVFEGKKGYPLYVPTDKAKTVFSCGSMDEFKQIFGNSDMNSVETGEEGCILSTDTGEGYSDIQAFVAKGFAREKLELLTARKRIFLVHHGQIIHDGGAVNDNQEGSLSDEGRRQAIEAGRRITELMREDVEAEALGMDKFGKEPLPAIERIYSGDSAAARETAELIKENVNDILPKPVSVKEYENLRGAEDGENCYDIQYRAVAALRDILRNDDAKDIIIVTHSQVIRALENKINGGCVDDDWEPVVNGQFRMMEPFPLQPSEKVHGEKPMNMNDLTMESVLEYYE